MPPSKSSRPSKTLIDEFCNITGADKPLARSLLEACGNNLEMAVNMHMEGVHDGSASSNSDGPVDAARGTPVIAGEEETVRAPIPQKQEVLVEGLDELAYTFRGKRRIARSVFDKFRDFEAETKRQEEELLGGSTGNEAGAIAGASTSRSIAPPNRHRRKMKTLEDLFRPPIDLIYRGTFQAARDAGVSRKRWLMVNIQDSSEFACQVLNRDVWSTSAVKTIVKEHFIFWQVYHDSEEGQRYMMFYQVSQWPHVSVLDPRTGECLVTWHKLDAVTFCDLVTEFLSSYPSFSENSSPPKKKTRADMSESILEADEASQIEAAIKASLAEVMRDDPSPPSATVEDDDEDKEDSDALETFDSETDDTDYSFVKERPKKETIKRTFNGESVLCRKFNSAVEDEKNGRDSICNEEESSDNKCSNSEEEWKLHLGPPTDPESKLMLRLPDGSRDIVSMPSSSKLMALVKYVGSKGYSSEQYELITNFPRREISHMDIGLTLKDAGLFPQETVFIQAR